MTEVYRQLLNRTLVILASQAAKTFLVSFFIVYMFHLLVTRHLVAIAGFVSGYNLARPPPPLQLDRRPPHEADELDKVVDAFNGMCANLQRAYGDLREVNAKLERDLLGPAAGRRGRAHRASSAFAITPRPHPTGSGKPGRITFSPTSRSGWTPSAWIARR